MITYSARLASQSSARARVCWGVSGVVKVVVCWRPSGSMIVQEGRATARAAIERRAIERQCAFSFDRNAPRELLAASKLTIAVERDY